MKLFTLSKSLVERNFNQIALTILLVLCFQGIRAQTTKTLKEFLDQDACQINYGSALSAQIASFSQKFYSCSYLNENIEDYEKKLSSLSEKQLNVYEVYKAFQSTSKRLKLQYGKSNLPEYFLYKQFTLRDSSCGDRNIVEKLGNSFNDCNFCVQTAYCDKNQEEQNENTNFIGPLQVYPPHKTFIEAFQILWNCNNPNNQVEVTGKYDENTEKQLLQTNANGFDKVCLMCEVENCDFCSRNYSECLESNSDSITCEVCQKGFYLLEGECVEKCPPDYKQTQTKCIKCNPGTFLQGEICVECPKFCKLCTGPDSSEGFNLNIACDECQKGFYLLEGECVEKCPPDYKNSQTKCIKCKPGTFLQGETCVECSKFCKLCTGPDTSECQQCSEGFDFNKLNECVLNDFDLNPSFKPKKFIDPRTNTEKECNFSCDECVDSSDLCTKCNPELNYYVKEGDRLRCYNRCPLYFEPRQSTQDPLNKYIECVKSERYTSDLEEADKIRNEAKNRCPKQQYWDIQSKQCYKCTNNCISCNNETSCIECEPDYYWNDNRQTCSPCHPSCKKCTGPLSKDCLLCANVDKLFPNQNGICEENVTDILPQQKILTQNEIYGNLQVCKQFLNTQQNYSVEFSQKYSINDSKWESIKMMSKNSCTFLEFQNRYKYFEKNKQNCEDKEISQSTVGKNGDLVAIYSILLSQSRAQISSNEVNPQTLVEYAISKNFFSSSYLFYPTPTFACSNLQCVSQLDSLLYGFSSNDNSKDITIKIVKEIVLTSEKQTSLNCLNNGQQVNQNTVEEIEHIVNSSQYTLNTGSKQYFILYACGKSQQGSFASKPLLVQKYLGNGFFEVINVSNPLPSQVEVISLYGASNEQNDYLKKCDSKLSNSLSSYQIQKVSIVQVVEQDPNADKSELMFQQYNNKVEASDMDPAKCSCVETKDYILANENQGNQFITVITPQNKILTESINVQGINHILKKHNIDAGIMKANRLSITKIEADQFFYEYIQETVESAKKCYEISKSTPLCMINVLADLLFSNNQQCLFSQQIKSMVKNSDFRGLNDFIKKQSWCNLHQERCLKAQQTMKSCI
ncbi:hypothetical protein TTHERM_01246710 (macronuclear) [Tetrahymena thermophila SB210]|uniref:EGF-like domain-containing protein n=1 Tax=Tetrahymena thermophila (strain SB210) TaxID=312017 RepID=Q22AD9_TETTS|nr:hypothetical protein TTHERM_01246710 [Tetrahymena thermophila SB210]EAR82254.2 hypothetical protein TTHERM_01246710 [Tetrahymena thermophila SB210]|eukprot:XP_001029917.2 hypothetical protein TTHERM_01246710 [Tetrahymena thermophila SB210]